MNQSAGHRDRGDKSYYLWVRLDPTDVYVCKPCENVDHPGIDRGYVQTRSNIKVNLEYVLKDRDDLRAIPLQNATKTFRGSL